METAKYAKYAKKCGCKKNTETECKYDGARKP